MKSRAWMTYTNREMRKLIPLFVLGILYIAVGFFLGGKVVIGGSTEEYNRTTLLSFAWPEMTTEMVGDMFINGVLDVMMRYYLILGPLFEVILVWRMFLYENRSGISDFIQTLPIRDRDKTLIKIGCGEILIFSLSLIFAVVGTIACAITDPYIVEVADFFSSRADELLNSMSLVWQLGGMVFLSLSAGFLVLFFFQYTVHKMPVAVVLGFATLAVPAFLTYWYSYTKNVYVGKWISVAVSIVFPFPDRLYTNNNMLNVEVNYWEYPLQKVVFLLFIIVVSAVLISLALRFRWHIRRSNSTMINSEYLALFIKSGIAVCTGLGMGHFLDGQAPVYTEKYTWNVGKYVVVSVICMVVVFVVLHVTTKIYEKKQRA